MLGWEPGFIEIKVSSVLGWEPGFIEIKVFSVTRLGTRFYRDKGV